MSSKFYGPKHYFLDNNKLFGNKYNTIQNQQFSKTFYKPKEEKESSDLVLQKMQLSLNNFLSNLKKSENIDNVDPYLVQNQCKTYENERSFNCVDTNFNKNSMDNNIVFNNYQELSRGFIRGKEKSESNLIRKHKNSNKYYKSPYVKDKNQIEPSDNINLLHSFYGQNNKLNHLSKNIGNNNFDLSGMQRTNMDISLPLKADRNKNIILINENSSYSSEENKNASKNLNAKINNKTNKKKDPINIINNAENDNDYKKLVQRIREKRAEKNKEKEKIKNNIVNNTENINELNHLNGQKLEPTNKEKKLDSSNKKKSKKDLKEPFSKQYIDNNDELYSNSTILKRKKNILDGNIIKKEYSDEKDNDMKINYRELKRSNEGIYIPREVFDNNENNKRKKRIKNDYKEEDIIIAELNKNNNNENIKNNINNDSINYKLLPGMNFAVISPREELNEKFEINEENEEKYISKNKKNIFDKNLKISRNCFEIIKKIKNPNYKDEKDKILEKLLVENNILKNQIISKDKEIQQLNIDKATYNGWDSSKYQEKIKELELKLKDSKSLKGQINILKSQKTNLSKDFYKYKEMSETLKKENEKLIKEKDNYKRQRNKLNNEIKILKLNTSRSKNKKSFSKTTSKARLLTDKNKFKKNADKKCLTLENESITNTISNISRDPSIITNSTNNYKVNVNIVKNDNFSYLGTKKVNNNNDTTNDLIDIDSKNNTNENNKNIDLEKIISKKDKEIIDYKEQIQLLNKEIKELKETKKTEKSRVIKKKPNNNKNEDNMKNNNETKINNKKYIDEINELKNNLKKSENEKKSLKNKMENMEKTKNNNDYLQKQIEDLKKQNNYSNNQIKSLKLKNSELDEFYNAAKSFIKIIKPSNEKETNLYYKLKNQIEFLEKNTK